MYKYMYMYTHIVYMYMYCIHVHVHVHVQASTYAGESKLGNSGQLLLSGWLLSGQAAPLPNLPN